MTPLPIALSLLFLAPTPNDSRSSSAAALAAAASASGRPRECSSGSKKGAGQGPTIWQKARFPTLQLYCDSLSRARAQLASHPEESRISAMEAEKALPGRAAPKVALARASLALGDLDGAAKAFLDAKRIDPRSVEDPSTLHDLARVLRKTGNRAEALTVYRSLVPRVDLLGTTERRVAVLLEAAHATMAAEEAATGGAQAALGARPIDEAIAYLREARQRSATQLTGDVLLSLVLALDRAGEREEADAALSDAHRTGAKVRPSSLDYLSLVSERHALEALVFEGSDRAAAIKSWEAYLATPSGKGPWAAAAKLRLESLKKGTGKAKPNKAPGSKP